MTLVGTWHVGAARSQLYMLLFRTFRLETVELTRIDEGDESSAAALGASVSSKKGDDSSAVGVQMYWRNPDGFKPISGE